MSYEKKSGPRVNLIQSMDKQDSGIQLIYNVLPPLCHSSSDGCSGPGTDAQPLPIPSESDPESHADSCSEDRTSAAPDRKSHNSGPDPRSLCTPIQSKEDHLSLHIRFTRYYI